MAYVALYRKYRSQNFEELMGQDSVTTTLQNAIRTGRIAHAYLFYGARGCGKTSTARLLSRALNCVAQDGPTPTPCGVCRLCVSIREGTCMDVIEIDAASETGVDNVREKIIENVQYASSEARYKVYIIDEVHDLSAKAFDALLKTLEEPPPHVVFILATTEYQKVPITIRSRCQDYQFKRGSIQDLSAAVERVIRLEGFTADPEAVQAVARSAEGSWRDALSILEQVLAYSDGHISAATAHRALGTVGTEMLARVTETLSHGAWNETLDIAADLMDSGTDVRQLFTALGGHLRDLMLLAAGARQAAAQELGPDRLSLLQAQTTLFTPGMLLDMMAELSSAERDLRFSNQHRVILERVLCRLMLIGQGVTAVAVETQPRSTTRPLTTQSAVRAAVPDRSSDTPAFTAAPVAPSVVPRPPTHQEAQDFAARADTPSALSALDEEDDDDEEAALDTETAGGEPAPPPLGADSISTAREGDYVAPLPNKNGSGTAPRSRTDTETSTAPATPPASRHQFAEGVTLEVIQRAWPRIQDLVKKQSPSGASYLQKGTVVGLEGKTILIAFKEAFARDRIQNKGKELVEKKINEGLKTEGYRIQCVLEGQYGSDGVAVKSSSPPPSQGGGMTATMEMATLLDSPPVTAAPSGPSRVMDFEVPAAPPPAYPGSASSESVSRERVPEGTVAEKKTADNGTAGNARNGEAALDVTQESRSKDRTTAEALPVQDLSKGMLQDALDIFGGMVVSTEQS